MKRAGKRKDETKNCGPREIRHRTPQSFGIFQRQDERRKKEEKTEKSHARNHIFTVKRTVIAVE